MHRTLRTSSLSTLWERQRSLSHSDELPGFQVPQPLPTAPDFELQGAHAGSREISVEFSILPPKQTAPAHMATIRDEFGTLLREVQEHLRLMLDGQREIQGVLRKVDANMDALLGLGQKPTNHESDEAVSVCARSFGTSNNKIPDDHRGPLRLQRSHTVLPKQRKFMKDLTHSSDHLWWPSESSKVDVAKRNAAHGNSNSQIQAALRQDSKSTTRPELVVSPSQVWALNNSSRSSFADRATTELDDMRMLFEIFNEAEMQEEKAEHLVQLRKHRWQYYLTVLGGIDKQTVEIVVDSATGVLIFLNAIFIGVSMDHAQEGDDTWIVVDAVFSALFLLEIALKVFLNGFVPHFWGSSRYSNLFDACLVFIDLWQQLLVSVFNDSSSGVSAGPSASLFRIVKLGKLARMLRLLKSSVFNDLLTMLQGMLGGMSTLGWSMVLFVMAIYIIALVFRELFGKGNNVPNVTEMFSSVPRSMFTLFRCSFGDCNSPTGVPIFEYVTQEYGGLSGLCYCSFVFVITIGLFNVISAIFVERTMEAATAMQTKKKKRRMRDHTLWCTNVAKLIRRLIAITDHYDHDGDANSMKLTECFREVYALEVPCSEIDELAGDPEAIAALAALDIGSEDRDYLSDILDPDNGGTINVIELVEGLRRLRGDPRRSDIVTVNLMLRSVQKEMVEMASLFTEVKSRFSAVAPI